jgi:hypothetical protein
VSREEAKKRRKRNEVGEAVGDMSERMEGKRGLPLA